MAGGEQEPDSGAGEVEVVGIGVSGHRECPDTPIPGTRRTPRATPSSYGQRTSRARLAMCDSQRQIDESFGAIDPKREAAVPSAAWACYAARYRLAIVSRRATASRRCKASVIQMAGPSSRAATGRSENTHELDPFPDLNPDLL